MCVFFLNKYLAFKTASLSLKNWLTEMWKYLYPRAQWLVSSCPQSCINLNFQASKIAAVHLSIRSRK